MDSSFTRGAFDSPFLRAQEANHGHSNSFSLGPAMHDSGGFDTGSAPDAPQSTADLTAFVQNLLQQMQSRFQSMSDAILVRIDEMAVRIEDLERSVEDVLREVLAADGDESQVALPSPSSSPIRRAMAAPASPDVRKYSLGPPGSGSFPSVSPLISRYSSGGGSLASSGSASLNSPDSRRHSASNVPNSPDHRRHSSTGLFPAGPTESRPQLQTSGSFGSNSPTIRRASSLANVPSSPDARRRLELYSSGGHLR